MNLTPEQKKAALDIVSEIESDPEYARRPELHAKVANIKSKLSGPPPAPSVAMPLRPEQRDRISRQMATTARPLELPRHGIFQAAQDAVAGLAGGVYSGVPGLAPGLEAIGELSDTLVPGQDPRFNLFPRPGQIHQAMENSPQGPIVSSTVGAAVPLAGQAGLIGKGAQVAAGAALAPATKVFKGLAGESPGMARTVAAGAGTGAAIGAGEAAIRRAPAVAQVIHGQGGEVPPVDMMGELAAPAAMGGISSLLPGASSWATNPRTIVGRRAQTFARDKASGAHQQEPLKGLMEGQAGIDQAKELANRSYEDQFPRLEAPVRSQERRRVAEIDRDTRGALSDYEMSKGQAAAEIEPRIRGKLQEQGRRSGEDLQATLDQLEQEGVKFRSNGLMDAIRSIVAKAARSDTANGRAASKSSTLLDANARPLETEGDPGSAEVHTPYGQQLANIEAQAKNYLKDEGTVADYRNFLKYVKASAESGTAEKTFPFKEIVGAVREHMGAAEPRLAAATAKYREETTGQERAAGMVYGQDDLNALGKKAAHTKVDVPEAGDPFSPESLTPREEAAGRQRLIQLGDKTASAAARIPQRDELIRRGFGDEIRAMEQRLADVEQMSYATQQAHDDAVAKVKLETEAQLREISRELRPQTDAVLESKVAQEASKFRLSGLTHPLTLAALGATTHSPAHAMALETLAADKIGGRISQPIASTIATGPDAASMRSSIPGMMGIATAASGPGAAKSMVEQARKQKERFKNSIGSIVEYNRARKAQ